MLRAIRICVSTAFLLALCSPGRLVAQGSVAAHLSQAPATKSHAVVAVLWLEPLDADLARKLVWSHEGPYRMVQKNKTFLPHLLVVPAGATVSFPNLDPLFHNVFSLFDGKRFDLGLYEPGTSKDVRFGRPGISYIFCNIHPEMSAVVVALPTPLFAIARENGQFSIDKVPNGSYSAHLWVEGVDEQTLANWTHRITVTATERVDAGSFNVGAIRPDRHRNKFGKPYKPDAHDY